MKLIKFFIVAVFITFSSQFAKASTKSIAVKPEFLRVDKPLIPPSPPPQHRRWRRHHRYYRHHYRRRAGARVDIHLPRHPPPPPPPPRP